MAIAYVDAGAGTGTETASADLAPLCPATVNANDILIAHVLYTGTTNGPSTPSGWTLLSGPHNVGVTTVTARHWCFGKLAAGTEDGASVSFGTAGGTDGRAARIYRFSGWVSGTLADVVPSASFSSIAHDTDPQGPTVRTTVQGALAVALTCQDDNNTEEAIAGASGGTWGGFVTYVNATWGPQGIHIDLHVATPTSDPGTISGGAIVAANDESGTIGFEIRPTPYIGVAASVVSTATAALAAFAIASASISATGTASSTFDGAEVSNFSPAELSLSSSATSGFGAIAIIASETGIASAADSSFVGSQAATTEPGEFESTSVSSLNLDALITASSESLAESTGIISFGALTAINAEISATSAGNASFDAITISGSDLSTASIGEVGFDAQTAITEPADLSIGSTGDASFDAIAINSSEASSDSVAVSSFAATEIVVSELSLAPSSTVSFAYGEINYGEIAFAAAATSGFAGSVIGTSELQVVSNETSTFAVSSICNSSLGLAGGLSASMYGADANFVFPTQYAGLRYYDGSVRELCLVALADAPIPEAVWPVYKNGTVYAVYLVDTTDPDASTLRINTSVGIKAARLKT